MEYRFVTEDGFHWIEFFLGTDSVRIFPYDMPRVIRVQGNYREGEGPRESTIFTIWGLELLQRAVEFYDANVEQIRREFNEYVSGLTKPEPAKTKPIRILGAQLHDPY